MPLYVKLSKEVMRVKRDLKGGDLINSLRVDRSLSAVRVVSSSYLRLLIFLSAILIPVCASSSPAFHMMSSAYKLNKQGDNTQRRRTRALCGAPDNEVGQCFFNH